MVPPTVCRFLVGQSNRRRLAVIFVGQDEDEGMFPKNVS